MPEVWPWLAMAGLGALHGLNPASGWMLAAASGLCTRDWRQALRALWPIGLGHVASLTLAAAWVMAGLSLDRRLVLGMAIALLVISASVHLWRRTPGALRAPAGNLGMALWSFTMSSLHGAGLMLVPALVPLCAGDASAGSPPLLTALAAVSVHVVSMLLVTGFVALGLCRSIDLCVARLRRAKR